MTQCCGDCAHARLMPKDFRQRICRGGPPTPLLMPGPDGKPNIGTAYPLVQAADEGCSLFARKPVLDVAPSLKKGPIFSVGWSDDEDRAAGYDNGVAAQMKDDK